MAPQAKFVPRRGKNSRGGRKDRLSRGRVPSRSRDAPPLSRTDPRNVKANTHGTHDKGDSHRDIEVDASRDAECGYQGLGYFGGAR
jgi:hypothetical protein